MQRELLVRHAFCIGYQTDKRDWFIVNSTLKKVSIFFALIQFFFAFPSYAGKHFNLIPMPQASMPDFTQPNNTDVEHPEGAILPANNEQPYQPSHSETLGTLPDKISEQLSNDLEILETEGVITDNGIPSSEAREYFESVHRPIEGNRNISIVSVHARSAATETLQPDNDQPPPEEIIYNKHSKVMLGIESKKRLRTIFNRILNEFLEKLRSLGFSTHLNGYQATFSFTVEVLAQEDGTYRYNLWMSQIFIPDLQPLVNSRHDDGAGGVEAVPQRFLVNGCTLF